MQLPDPTQHKYHLQGEAAGITAPVDKRIIGMINDLVGDGVRSIVELRRHLDNFVKNELFRSENPHLGYEEDFISRRKTYAIL